MKERRKPKLNSGKSVVYALIAANILIFINLNFFPVTRDVFLLDHTNYLQKPWTLLSVFFSHENLLHLLANMGLLFFFGRELEKNIGGKKVLYVYFLAGLSGSLSIILYADYIGWSGAVAGASAAVFGVCAAYAILNPERMILRGKAIHWLISLFVVNLILTILNPELSIGGPAHALGVIIGVLFTMKIKKEKEQGTNKSK